MAHRTTRTNHCKIHRHFLASLAALAEWMFAAADADARQHGWQVTYIHRGLGRSYRDPRFSTMAARQHSPPPCDEHLLAELQQGMRPARRPSMLVLLWSCRYELVLLGGLPAAVLLVREQFGYVWIIAEIAAVTALVAICGKTRLWLRAQGRCPVAARHLLPTQRAQPCCQARTCLPGLGPAGDILDDAWADEIHVLRAPEANSSKQKGWLG